MSSKSGARQAERMRRALKAAFAELLRERGYAAITVSDIAKRADVGRSTFYYHYQSKADLLLGWHEDIFASLQIGQTSAEEWLADAPPAALIAFFERMIRSRMPLQDLGDDGAFVLRGIGAMLAAQIEDNLRRAFPDREPEIPMPVVAQTIAGIYVWIFFWWVMAHPDYSP